MSVDPLALVEKTKAGAPADPYAYSSNNPLRFLDPSGHDNEEGSQQPKRKNWMRRWWGNTKATPREFKMERIAGAVIRIKMSGAKIKLSTAMRVESMVDSGADMSQVEKKLDVGTKEKRANLRSYFSYYKRYKINRRYVPRDNSLKELLRVATNYYPHAKKMYKALVKDGWGGVGLERLPGKYPRQSSALSSASMSGCGINHPEHMIYIGTKRPPNVSERDYRLQIGLYFLHELVETYLYAIRDLAKWKHPYAGKKPGPAHIRAMEIENAARRRIGWPERTGE